MNSRKTFFLRIFSWTLAAVGAAFIVTLFLTPDLTHTCTDNLIDCLSSASDKPLLKRLWYGFGCVFKNIWCVLTALF